MAKQIGFWWFLVLHMCLIHWPRLALGGLFSLGFFSTDLRGFGGETDGVFNDSIAVQHGETHFHAESSFHELKLAGVWLWVITRIPTGWRKVVRWSWWTRVPAFDSSLDHCSRHHYSDHEKIWTAGWHARRRCWRWAKRLTLWSKHVISHTVSCDF